MKGGNNVGRSKIGRFDEIRYEYTSAGDGFLGGETYRYKYSEHVHWKFSKASSEVI